MSKTPKDPADHRPIQPEHHDQMNALAGALDEMLNPGASGDDRKIGFFLAVFPFGQQGRFNYISNADKLDVRQMVRDVGERIDMRTKPGGQA